MRKTLNILFICLSVLILTACSSKSATTGNVSDADQMAGSTAQTQGLGEEDDLADQDVGPRNGLLGKRSYYFSFDSNAVNPNDYPAVKAHARYLMDHSTARVLVEGNCDERGSREYNIALGERRANSIADLLRSEGVSENQIRTVSYGSEKPHALGHTAEDYRINRRDDLLYESK